MESRGDGLCIHVDRRRVFGEFSRLEERDMFQFRTSRRDLTSVDEGRISSVVQFMGEVTEVGQP